MAHRNFAQIWQCRHHRKAATVDHIVNLCTRNAEIAQHDHQEPAGSFALLPAQNGSEFEWLARK
jgi:hypothetical protein